LNSPLRHDSDSLAHWRDTVDKLAAVSGSGPGLMPDAMAHALQATAAPLQRAASTPPAPSALGWQDWWEKRDLITRREVSVREIAQVALDRLANVQSTTSACVELLRDAALEQASRLDLRLAAGESLGLLGGMPLAHKDLLHRAGREVGYGMSQPATVASRDATVLSRFDHADALNLARLHMTELAFDPSGANAAAGDCRNPWSTDRIPGGSSSGSAAVVAAGAVDGALGSDTGGSIRIPAALCGVTGLKPTFGLVSRTGAMSLSATHDHLGPIARSARDCALMLEAVAGFDAADAGSLAAPYPGANYTSRLHMPLTGMRLGVPRGYFAANIHPKISAVIEQSIASFRQLGVEIVEVPDFPYDAINALAIMMIRAEATALYEQLITKTGQASLGAFTRSRLQEGFSIPATLYLQASALRGPLLMRFAQTVLAGVDVLLAPVFPLPTPRIDAFAAIDPQSQLLRGELTRLTRPINFLGLPSLALPGGMCTPDDGGNEMPVGFQLIGRPYGEALLFQFGHAFQQATPWHLRRPPMP